MTSSDSSGRVRNIALISLLLLLTATLIRISLVNDLSDQGFFAKYTEIAESILDGHIPYDRMGDLSTGYLWFVVLCFGPLGINFMALRTAQIIGVSLAAATCGAAAWRRWGLPAGITSATTLLVSRAALVNATEIEPETLILVLSSLGLSLIVASEKPVIRTVAGLALGLAVVTRPSVLLPVVMMLSGLVWKGLSRRRPSDPAPSPSTLNRCGDDSCPPHIPGTMVQNSRSGIRHVRPHTCRTEDEERGARRSARWSFGGTGSLGPTILPLIFGVTFPILATHLAIFWTTGAPPTPMNPGTVLSEGWNPMATGYLGEAPEVVKDIEHSLNLPDGLHVAYRLVAARATGTPPSSELSNGFWAKRALAFVRYEPRAAFILALRKASLALHSYDAWDLKTLQKKSEQMHHGPFLPFGLLTALAALGLILGWRRPLASALGFWVVGGWLVMIVFYVTARQRNVLLPATALLAGIAITEISAIWSSGRRRVVYFALPLTLLSGAILSMEGIPQIEDRHGWRLLGAQEATTSKARAAKGKEDAAGWLARAATFLDRPSFLTADPRATEREIRLQLAQPQPPQRHFDLALVLIDIGQFKEAEGLLQSLEIQGYQPRRGARWCSSTAYHLARCRLRVSDFSGARSLIERAQRQAPGDPRILALKAVLSETEGNAVDFEVSSRALNAMFDPFTVDQALARAYRDCGQTLAAAPLLAVIRETLPEWNNHPQR